MWPKLENHQLSTIAAHIGHKFNHHHAQDDAEAAGRVLLAAMKYSNANTVIELAGAVGIQLACAVGQSPRYSHTKKNTFGRM